MRALSFESFVEEAGASPEVIHRLVEVGTIVPLPDGRYEARDEVVASTAQALLDAGIALDDLVWSLRHTGFGFRSVRGYVAEPAPRSTRTHAEHVERLGTAGAHVPAVYAALGLPEPASGERPRADEAEVVADLVRLWTSVDPSGDGAIRAARLIGDGLRRAFSGWADLWDEVARPDPAGQGAPTTGDEGPPTNPNDPAQNAAIQLGEVSRRLVRLVHERHLEATLHGRVIWAIERVLEGSGRLPVRPARPPAVAFVDLSGFTSLTESRGDEAAARMASDLLRLAESATVDGGGRVVKQLGDGVLLRFADTRTALGVVVDLVARVEASGLPPAHAGIAAGPIIVRDGDVFGRTVNLAARLSDVASPGETLVEEGVVVALPGGTATFEAIGRLELGGLAEPVAVWRVSSATRAGAVR